MVDRATKDKTEKAPDPPRITAEMFKINWQNRA